MLQACNQMTFRGPKQEKFHLLFPAGIEPATSPVWRVRDNHYTKETLGNQADLPGKIGKNKERLLFGKCPALQLGLVAQRITRLTTDQKIAGSNPAEIENFYSVFFFFWILIGTKKECAPGWARTTNLSVNSRTR